MIELSVIALPQSTQIIEEEAFAGISALRCVKIPDGLSKIESRAFADTGLVLIHIPDSVTMIAEDAFTGCEDVTIDCSNGSYAWEYANNHRLAITESD